MAKIFSPGLIALLLSNFLFISMPFAEAKKNSKKEEHNESAKGAADSAATKSVDEPKPAPSYSPSPDPLGGPSSGPEPVGGIGAPLNIVPSVPGSDSRSESNSSSESNSKPPENLNSNPTSSTEVNSNSTAQTKDSKSATSDGNADASTLSSGKPKKFVPIKGGMQVPNEDMPPEAPTFSQEPPPRPPSQMFNLQAQQIDVRAQQQDPRMMQPPGMMPPGYMQGMNPQYGNQQPYYGNARNNNLNANNNYLNGNVNQNGDPRSLTQVDLRKMANHDVVLLIDRSSSMASMDCPNVGGSQNNMMPKFAGSMGGLMSALMGLPLGMGMGTSRWQWCLHQTADLSRQTQSVYNQGITVCLFSTGFVTLPNVTLDAVPRIFNENFPFGGTNLAPALASQIGEYFRRREYANGNVKPLMIGIITDGCPNNRTAVRQAIIQATQLMRNPQEVTIIFFLIGGMDYVGEQFVQDLTVHLVNQGARFNIVRAVSFGELQRMGLAKSIADNLQ